MGFRRVIGVIALVATVGVVLTHQKPVVATGERLVQGVMTRITGKTALTMGTGKEETAVTRTTNTKSIGTGSTNTKSTSVGTVSAKNTSALRRAPVVTIDNAPPIDPVTIHGVYLRYNPFKPSDGPYPVLTPQDHVWIDVSISQQLVYIFNGKQLLYTMVTSSGIDTAPDNSTPLGTFHIQDLRGKWFYAQQYQEGGRYWVSWLGHGVFLFHSVPMNQQQQLLLPIAAKLGHKASEGCFHLTIPDAQWVFTHIPYHTTVLVEQAPVRLQSRTLYHPTPDQLAAEQASETASQAADASGTQS
ncbi:MAG: L,D-transpeptidase [Bacilli bacterium]